MILDNQVRGEEGNGQIDALMADAGRGGGMFDTRTKHRVGVTSQDVVTAVTQNSIRLGTGSA